MMKTMEAEIHNRSYIIPAWDLKLDAKSLFRQQAFESLSQRAVVRFESKHITMRDLRYSDLGLHSWRTPAQPSGIKTIWINHRLNEHQLISIYGIALLGYNPKVSQLRIGVAGSFGAIITGLHGIERLQAVLPIIRKIGQFRDDQGWLRETFGDLQNLRMEGYFAKPYLWDNENVVWIEVESSTPNKRGDRILLNGYIAELAGAEIA